jgi:23S rRNA (adenine2503-C2)-methyltransferase
MTSPSESPAPDSAAPSKIQFTGLDRAQLAETLAPYGVPAFRARQIFDAVQRRWVRTLDDLHELPKSLRAQLRDAVSLDPVTLTRTFDSSDGTRRYLFTVEGGEAIEAVWIPEAQRATICLSSQAGCPMMCEFCMTALMGLKRNLTAGEIVGQVIFVLRDERERARRAGRTEISAINLVFMGMGEPFLNYDNVMHALRLLADPEGLRIAPHHVTLSTVGVTPKIDDFGREPNRPRLAVSLSAPNDALRDRLMPINKRYPLKELMRACSDFPLRPDERITFEYVMLDGVNDRDEHARETLKLLAPLRARNAAKVNLIPHNPAPGLPFRPSSPERVERFQNILKEKSLPTFVRRPRGRDIFAACGMLAANRPSA